MSEPLKWARLIAATLLGLSVLYFVAMKAAWLPAYPLLFASAVIALCLWGLFELFLAVVGVLRRRIGILSFVGRALLLCGGLLLLGGGLANWMYRLQGFVIMAEGEDAPFFHGMHLQEFDAGWLSDPREMELILRLKKIRLEGHKDVMVPVTSLVLSRYGQEPHAFELSPGKSVRDGPLRFFHGAFGYAPRIVITRGEETLFDKTVPFTTVGAGQVSFVGEFTVAEHDLRVRGEMVLVGAEGNVPGHPRLEVSVAKGAELLGVGMLRLGHFGPLAQDHRVGFAGMVKWAEIDILRKTYSGPMYLGVALAAAGLLVLGARFAYPRLRRA